MSDVKVGIPLVEETIKSAKDESLSREVKKEDYQYEIQSLSAAFQSVSNDNIAERSVNDPQLNLKVTLNTTDRIKKEPRWDENNNKDSTQKNMSHDSVGKHQDDVTANQQEKSIFDILKTDGSTMTDENPTFSVNVNVETDIASKVTKLENDDACKSEENVESIGSLSAVYDMECNDEMTKRPIDRSQRRLDVTLPKTEDIKKEPELDIKDKNRIGEPKRVGVSNDGNLQIDLVASSSKKLKQDLAKDVPYRNLATQADISRHLPPQPATTVSWIPLSLSSQGIPLFVGGIAPNLLANVYNPLIMQRNRYQKMIPAYKCNICGACFPTLHSMDKHAAIHTADTNRLSSEVISTRSIGTSTSSLHPKTTPSACGIRSSDPSACRHNNVIHDKTFTSKSTFVTNEQLQEHSESHPTLLNNKASDHKYACGECGKTFSDRRGEVAHRKLHSSDYKYACGKCGKTFSDRRAGRAHRKVHERVTCSVCNASICNSTTLQVHMRIHTGELPHQCNQCGAQFRYKSTYKVHLATHLDSMPYVCEICNTGFGLLGNLKRHKLVHTDQKPYECQLCDSKFRTKVGLKKHQSRHSNEKPFNCETCNQNFKTKHGLESHKLSHTHKKDFSCDSCSAKYYLKSQLEYHKKIHLKERQFECSKCDKSFSKKDAYKRHERVHTGERPFKCKICNAAFKYDPNLLYHLKTHTDSKPFVCDTCGMGFKLKHHLKNHQQTHISGKTLGCNVCGKRLKSMRSFKRHQLSHAENGSGSGSNEEDTEEEWSSNSDEEDAEEEWSANSEEEDTEEELSANSDEENTEEDQIGNSDEKSVEQDEASSGHSVEEKEGD